MNSEKGVIRIIKLANHPSGYDEHYYFTDVVIDNNGHLMARNTTNIWDAMKFQCVNGKIPNVDEWRRISSLMEFIKTCYDSLPEKYLIEFTSITLNY